MGCLKTVSHCRAFGILILSCTLAACSSSTFSGTKAFDQNETTMVQALAQASTDRDRSILETYFELAKIPRPSGSEQQIRQHLISISTGVNERLGKEVIRHQIDSKGNILFMLEGSGRFAGQTTPVVTLQGHLDMVWAVSQVAPGTDLTPYFENGVQLALDQEGWLRSAEREDGDRLRRTTIGVDNGIGVSMAVRYMRDFEVEHPPMDLVFTVGEEAGLRGVRDFGLVLRAPVLINLDAFFVDTFIYGCLGNARVATAATFPATAIPNGSSLVRFQITGLRGGHSGHDIGKPRLNAVVTTIKIAMALTTSSIGDTRLVAVDAGNPLALGAIPTAGEFIMAVPSGTVDAAKSIAHEVFAAALARASDEDPASARLDISLIQDVDQGLSSEDSKTFQSTILEVMNGPISYWDQSPTGVNTSSNLGALKLMSGSSEEAKMATAGFMSRSYDKGELDGAIAANRSVFDGWQRDSTSIETYTQPWQSDVDGAFYALARELLPDFRLNLTGGTNELAVLTGLFPDVTMLSMGPQIQDAHSPGERVKLSTIFSTSAALDQLVQGIGRN